MTMTGHDRRLRFKVCLAVVALTIAFGACEVGARLLFPAPPDGTRQPQVAYYQDPEIRYVIAPNQQGWIDDGLVTVNYMGFRRHEVDSTKLPHRFHNVVTGYNVTLGWCFSANDT